MMHRRATLLMLVTLPLVASCRRDGGSVKVGVIPKGTTHEFWKSVHAGAVKAAREHGKVELVWKGPLKEDDLKSQIDIVESMVAQGVAGIVLAPLNDKALVNAVKGAMTAKIPVVIIDSALQGKDYVSYIATDNVAAGARAAGAMAKVLGDKGKVMVLRYQEGSASTTAREEGFVTTLRKSHGGVAIVSDSQYGGATTESAFAAGENLLVAQRASEGGVDGVFCPNESTTFGMLLALEKAGLAGKLKLIGFDASDKLLSGLRAGHIDGLIVQDPMRMGELGVRTVLAAIRGERSAPILDTGSRLVTKKDLDDPAVMDLIHPDLQRWLKE